MNCVPNSFFRHALRPKLICFLSFWFSAGISLVSAPHTFSGFGKASNLVMPIYSTTNSELQALLRVREVYSGQKKVGFFRVKLLPLIVGEGVRLEFAQSRPDGNAVPQMHKAFRVLTRAQEFELKDFAFCLAGEAVPRLEARRVLPSSNGHSLQLEGVRFPGRDHEIVWSRASLQVQSDGEIHVVSGTRSSTVTFKFFEGSFTTNQVQSSGESK